MNVITGNKEVMAEIKKISYVTYQHLQSDEIYAAGQYYTVPKKRDSFFIVTQANVQRFSKLFTFHFYISGEIMHVSIAINIVLHYAVKFENKKCYPFEQQPL